MARFLVLAAFGAALSTAAPTNWAPAAGIAAPVGAIGAVGVGAVGAVAAAPAVIGGHVGYAAGPTHVSEQVHAGPAVARTHVQHGVVGHRTVQAGSRTVQVGHQYNVAGTSVHQPPAYSVVERPATNAVNTVPIPVPAAPVPAPAAAIPPAPRNLGPRPADTIVNEPVLGLGRTHTIVTPQRTEVIPQLNVNKYQVDVPVPVPTPVERTVIVEKPDPVHQVKHIVETPVIEKRTYTHVQPVAVTKTVGVAHVAHAAPVAAVAAAPVAAVGAVAAPAAAIGYTGAAIAAPAAAGVIAAPAAAGIAGGVV